MSKGLKERVNALREIEGWRMAVFLLVSLALGFVCVTVAKHLASVTVYKITLATFGGWMGFWLDIMLFPGARPAAIRREAFECWPLVYAAAQLRRAIVVIGTMASICWAA